MLQLLVREYEYIHLGIGLFGNLLFVVGSVLFLPMFKPLQTFAVWLFIIGSFGMLIGSLGRLAKTIYEARERRGKRERQERAGDAGAARGRLHAQGA